MNELRRKAFHIASGTAIALLYYYSLISKIHLIILLAIAVILFFAYKYYKIPIVHQLITTMERKENLKQAGLASILFLLGCTITVILYQKNIAIASILILAFGDGTAGLIRMHTQTKTWTSTIAGIITATITAQFFATWMQALITSVAAMLAERINFRIDDNLYLPILAGAILTLLS
ncbi:MAG: hypothetical protein NTW67_01835 [Candidatus Woesearchaeota archaeon]|nr:hypothetical protein [Candidatus Woesearchaeota archaeon]